MLSFLKRPRLGLRKRRAVTKHASDHHTNTEQSPDIKPLLSAEHHVLEIRKLAAQQCPHYSHDETFAVSYHAPDELYIEMAMQFIAHSDQGRLEDGHEPFAYLRRSGNQYIFQVT